MFNTLIEALGASSPELAALATLVLVLLAGTAAQILADRMRIPATGPLLIAGLLLGPAVLGLVQPDVLGRGLRVIVSMAVAIVIFEGGMLLDVHELRRISRAVLGLVTVGLLITTSLASLITRLLLGWPWELCLLFGAIVSVTGPTVITPILQKVRVNLRVKATLESESVIADPLGVILAAMVFTSITSAHGWSEGLAHAGQALLTGAAVGGCAAGVTWLLAKRLHVLPIKFSRLVILGTALAAYTVAELSAHEAGVLAAAVAGITIGSMDIPHKEQIEEFKGDLASIAISTVFILLAASLKPDDLLRLGWKGLAVVALIMVFVRPVRVFLSTWGSELKTNEKAFISLLGPRGIVAASVATFFSLALRDNWPTGAGGLVALVFGVILATVLIEGSAAGWLARVLRVMPRHTIIVGADETGRLLARDLIGAGESVALIDTDAASCALAREIPGARVVCADGTETASLKKAGADLAECFVATTRSDKLNLLACEIAKAHFAIGRFVARANTPSSVTAFEAAGIEAMSPARATATILKNMVLRPSLFRLLSAGGGAERVVEVAVTSTRAVGQSLKDLALPDVLVVVVRRAGSLIAPHGVTRLQSGDVLTLLGTEQAIEQAERQLSG